jgi:hypothetical protein
MKLRIASWSLLVLILAAVPAVAQTVYNNGSINGNVNGWTINFGFIVSDSFNVTNNSTTITGGSFGIWLFPGDTLTSAELSITSGENGGTSYFDQTVNFTQGACSMNQFGYNVCTDSTVFNGPTLNTGTFWLNLQNGSVPSGDPVFWDMNSGPSSASANNIGTIFSESFTLLGSESSTAPSVPEPSSLMLFASGVLGLAGLLRRRLF